MLPYFTPAAIPGLTVGCLLSNILFSGMVWDIVFGSLATLIGAILAYFFRRLVYLVPIPNIVSNTVIIPLVLRFACGSEEVLPFLFLSIGVSELLSSGLLGLALLLLLRRYGSRIFKKY